jgi:hypothetical protein
LFIKTKLSQMINRATGGMSWLLELKSTDIILQWTPLKTDK